MSTLEHSDGDRLTPRAERPVIDLGAGENPDPRADYTADLHSDADYSVDLREPWPWATNSVDGLIARHVFEHFTHGTLQEHVFPELSRVLKAGGWLEIRVPVGSNARTDPTHRSFWEYRTPLFYADSNHPWVPDYGLQLTARTLDLHMISPLGKLTRIVHAGAARWPNEAWYELPGVTGQLIATYTAEDTR